MPWAALEKNTFQQGLGGDLSRTEKGKLLRWADDGAMKEVSKEPSNYYSEVTILEAS